MAGKKLSRHALYLAQCRTRQTNCTNEAKRMVDAGRVPDLQRLAKKYVVTPQCVSNWLRSGGMEGVRAIKRGLEK